MCCGSTAAVLHVIFVEAGEILSPTPRILLYKMWTIIYVIEFTMIGSASYAGGGAVRRAVAAAHTDLVWAKCLQLSLEID